MGIHDHHDGSLINGEFAEADLLDLIEGTMTSERAVEFVQSIRERDPELLRTITRMQADRLALSNVSEVAPPRNLFASLFAQPTVSGLGGHADAVEPTQAMERSLRDLDRSRRWRRQAPIRGAIAAGIAGIGVTTIALVLADSLSPGVTSLRENVAFSSPAVVPTRTGVERPEVDAPDPLVAEYGVVLEGVEAEELGQSLSDLFAYGNLTLVENLTFEEGAARLSGGDRELQAAIQAGDGAVVLMQSEMQPLPLLGDESTAPSSAIRFDLAQRGFRYAVVVDRDAADVVIERIGRLGANASLVSAHVTPRHGQFVLDAWHDWQVRDASKSAERLIVPIACGR